MDNHWIASDEGPLRLVVISAMNDQVVDGHWTVKWLNEMDVEPVGQAWSLDLQGAVSSPVDRASFQSCGSPSCHGTSWVDTNGQNWVGVPLWLLVGQVDDTNTHLDGAFNDALADAGYTVDIIGSDGNTVTLDSATIKRNNSILVAYEVNAAELPEQYYPLRLVGSGVQSGQMVGKIAQDRRPRTPGGNPNSRPGRSRSEHRRGGRDDQRTGQHATQPDGS